MIRFLISILFICFLASPGYCLEISFLSKAEVSNEFITLGDVANFDVSNDITKALSDKVISKSPDPGENITLQAIDISKTILRKTTLSRSTIWSGSPTVTIFRHGQKIDPPMIENAINTFLVQNRKNLPDAKIRFIASSMPLPFIVPSGKLQWEIIPSNPAILHCRRMAIILRVDGRVRKNISIPGKIEALASMVAAAVPLKRGSILTPENIFLTVKDITDFKNPCLDTRTILGKRLKRSVRAGNVISNSDVEFPPLVRKGQLVKIIIRKNSLYLSATGIAKMNGKINQIIRVRNANSNKLIYCKVTAPGIVEVVI